MAAAAGALTAGPIRRLAPSLADAIAAGEVVERPASVVKELCENALDAGARRIEVEVEGAGTVRVRVVDDGAGIDAGDLPLAVARHATSKIAAHGDLETVLSLGFRGEALASMAAVSDMVITTRAAGAGVGARLRVRASALVEHGAAACAPGTAVEVRDLFFNTPARLRFLRSGRSEIAAAVRVVAELAMTHPEVAMLCRVDGRTAVRTNGGGTLDAVRAVLGAAAGELIEVTAPGEITVTGAVSQPRAHRGSAAGLVLAVNRRRVHNRALQAAVTEAYRGLLPGGRHPYGLIELHLHPAGVDVNVHPTKREVRFRDEGAAFVAVQRAVWAALRESRPYEAHVERAEGGSRAWLGRLQLSDSSDHNAGWPRPVTGAGTHPAGEARSDGGGEAFEPAPWAGPLRAVGQVGSAWLVAESAGGVVLVDPHAAHEKVIYLDLLAAWGDARTRPDAAQLLLLPVVVDCDAAQMAHLDAHAGLAERCGFALEPFGPGLLRCTAVPAAAAAADAGRLVRDLLDTLADASTAAEHRVAALVSCHAAVRFGDHLSAAEQQVLLDRLVRAGARAATCPHGRPTVLVLDDATLRRAFRRPL